MKRHIPTPKAHGSAVGFETLEPRQLLSANPLDVKINFQPAKSPVPAGYMADSGQTFGSRGNGLSYGWNKTNPDTRDRNAKLSPDQRYDTLIQMGSDKTHFWELAVPNGKYQVHIVCGDPSFTDSHYEITAEGVLVVDGLPSNSSRWVEGSGVVTVTDGRLTVANSPVHSKNNKLDFIEVQSLTGDVPQVSVAASDADASEEGSAPGTFTFTRSGDTSGDLTVKFNLGGTALNGVDYNTLPTSVIIPAGQSSATLNLTPIDDSIFDPEETATVTLANSADYTVTNPASAAVTIHDNDPANSLFSAHINFQPEPAPKPPGYSIDIGGVFAMHTGGLMFGWNTNDTDASRDRNSDLSADQRFDTLVHMQYGGVNHSWSLAVPDGTYQVHLVAGDAEFFTGNHYKISVEGTLAIDAVPTSSKRWAENTVTVSVTDGRLNIDNASGAANNRICFVDVQQMS